MVHPSPRVLAQVVEGETILLDLESEHYFVFDNAAGTRCWQLLEEYSDVEKVIAVMLDEFDVDKATLRADVEALVEELREAGLVLDTPG